jgi:hypothetical protein
MEVSDQLHPGRFTSGEEAPSTNWRYPEPVWTRRRRKGTLLLPGIKPGHPAPYVITILTEVPWFLLHRKEITIVLNAIIIFRLIYKYGVRVVVVVVVLHSFRNLFPSESRDRSFTTITRLWSMKKFFSLRHRVQIGSGAHPTSYPMVTEEYYLEINAAGV